MTELRMTTWSPAQYLKFTDERLRPARELLARVPMSAPLSIVDLGCGPATSTAILAERWGQAQISGVDSSAAMIETARAVLPSASFSVGDVATWTLGAQVDLIFANAVLHWLPDHAALLPRLMASLAPGGVLALQMPDNLYEPSHELMREAAQAGPWSDKIGDIARDELGSPGDYYNWLKPHAAHLDIWHSVYTHVMDGPDAIVEWVRGAGLRPYLDPLGPDEQAGFLDVYGRLIAQAYPPMRDGKVLFRFPRLFMVAVKGD
jgi:trans-aconitate 2-methyltransferase